MLKLIKQPFLAMVQMDLGVMWKNQIKKVINQLSEGKEHSAVMCVTQPVSIMLLSMLL